MRKLGSAQVITADGLRPTVVDVSSSTATPVTTKPAKLWGIYINEAPSHDVEIRDGATRVFIVPALYPAGETLAFMGAEFSALTVTPDASASAGDITILYDEFVD